MFEVLKQDLGVKTKLPEVSRSCPGIAPSDLFNIFNPDGKSNFAAFKAGRIESLEYVQSLKMNAETVATTCMRA